MIVLGLDLAQSYGWCVVDAGRYIASGNARMPQHERVAVRVIGLRNRIADLITQYAPDVVAVERPMTRGYFTDRALMSYATAAEEVAYIRECRHVEYGRATCCKTVLGHGNAKKPEGVIYARQFRPILNNDDEADAILVAMTAHALRGLPLTAKPKPAKRTIKPKLKRAA